MKREATPETMKTLKSSETRYFSKSIEVDEKLEQCEPLEMLEQISKKNLKEFDNIGQKLSCNSPAFPTDYALVTLSNASYNGIDKQNDLPEGWKFLTAAWNTNKKNGYFGAAYMNIDDRHIVIAHRGTKLTCWGALHSDLHGVGYNAFVAQLSSAITFADEMITVIDRVNEAKEEYWKLSFTGHSLGGWLAQVTTFSVKYLVKTKFDFGIVDGFEEEFRERADHHVHTVVFDSPGCKGMLEKLKDEYYLRYKHGHSIVDLDSLDISSYLSEPNRVNTYNKHLGAIFKLNINTPSGWDPQRYTIINILNVFTKGYFTYNLDAHSINSIAECFDSVTGNVAKDHVVKQVLDWPVVTFPVLSESEYKNYFRNLNASHDHRFDICTNICIRGENVRFHTCEVNPTLIKFNIFASKELEFLFAYNFLRQLPQYQTEIFNLDSDDKKVAFTMFEKQHPTVVIDYLNETIQCPQEKTPQEYVSVIKRVVHFCPGMHRPTNGPHDHITNIKHKIYKIASDKYLKQYVDNCLQFDDVEFELAKILDDRHQIFIQREEITFAGMLKIYKTFESIKYNYDVYLNDNCLFLDTTCISNLKCYMNFKALFSKIDGDFLLVIECNGSDYQSVVLEITEVVRNKPKIKLILVVHQSMEVEVGNHGVSSHTGIRYQDLTEDCRKQITTDKLILLQKQPINLTQIVTPVNGWFDSNLYNPSPFIHSNRHEGALHVNVRHLIDSKRDIFAVSNVAIEEMQMMLRGRHRVKVHRESRPLDTSVRFVIFNGVETEFRKICKYFEHNVNIHWLLQKNGRLLLWDSYKTRMYENGDEFVRKVFCDYFQVKDIFLDLRLDAPHLDIIMGTQTLIDLGNNRHIEAGSNLMSLGKQAEFYVDRVLKAKLEVVDVKYVLDNVVDVFTISHLSGGSFDFFEANCKRPICFYNDFNEKWPPICLVILDECYSIACKQFRKICENMHDRCVHWLMEVTVPNSFQNEQLATFASTYKKFKYPRDHFLVSIKCSSPEKRSSKELASIEFQEQSCNSILRCIPDKVVVVDGVPGMGKSFLFTNLAQNFKNECGENLWVVKVNLVDLSQKLAATINTKVSSPRKVFDGREEVLRFLIDGLELKTTFEIALFKFYIEHFKVVFFFDGFDEITPLYGELYNSFIKILSRELNPMQIWLSTRPSALKELRLGKRVYTLKGFEYNDANKYLKMYFQRHGWPLFTLDNDLKFFWRHFDYSTNDITEIPLMLELAANVFNNKRQSEICDVKFDVSSLYENIIDESVKRCVIKAGIDLARSDAKLMANNNAKSMLKNHKRMALYSLFRNGIITDIIDDVPVFIHRTFAEYLATWWLVDKINEIDESDDHFEKINRLFTFLYRKFLVKNEPIPYSVIDKKLNAGLAERLHGFDVDRRKLITRTVENGSTIFLSMYKDTLRDMIVEEGKGFQLLHVAIEYQKEKVVKFILDNFGQYVDKMVVDELLWVAVEKANINNVNKLLETLEKYSLERLKTCLAFTSNHERYPGRTRYFRMRDKNFEKDLITNFEFSPLTIAIYKDNVEAIAALLPHYTFDAAEMRRLLQFVRKQETSDMLVGHMQKAHPEAIVLFLSAVAEDGTMFVHEVASGYNVITAEALVKLCIDLNFRYVNEEALLSIFVHYNRINIVELLLRRSFADFDDVRQAVHRVHSIKSFRMLENFIRTKWGASGTKELLSSKQKGDTLLHSLIRNGFFNKYNNENGSFVDQEDILDLITSLGVKLDEKNEMGETPLIFAARYEVDFFGWLLLRQPMIAVSDGAICDCAHFVTEFGRLETIIRHLSSKLGNTKVVELLNSSTNNAGGNIFHSVRENMYSNDDKEKSSELLIGLGIKD